MSAPSQWTYSPTLKGFYKFDAQRNAYVLQDGSTVSREALSGQASRASPASSGRATGQSASSPRSASKAVPKSNLRSLGTSATSTSPASYGALSSSPSAQNEPAYLTAPSFSPPAQYSSLSSAMASLNMRSEPEGEVFIGNDEARGIRSAIQFEPPQVITEPEMYSEGIEAHAKLVALPTPYDTEALDSKFAIRKAPNKFFVLGRVFLVLWAEPAPDQSLVTTFPVGTTSPGQYREQVFSKVRRFVVIRSGDRSCSALPIYTYNGKGARKTSLLASEHGHIFTGKSLPDQAARVDGMLKKALRMLPDEKSDKLDPQSLIHYGKVYTIEHNIKVKPLGMIHEDHMAALRNQFTDVWIFRAEGSGRATRRPQGGAGRAPYSLDSGAASGPRQGNYAPQQMPNQTLTERQSAAYQEYGAIAEQRERAQRVGSSGRRSTQGSAAGGEPRRTASVASGGPASARPIQENRYQAAMDALVNQGHSPENAINMIRQRLSQQETNTPSSVSLSSSPSQQNIEAAIGQLIVQRGFTRQQAIEHLRRLLGG